MFVGVNAEIAKIRARIDAAQRTLTKISERDQRRVRSTLLRLASRRLAILAEVLLLLTPDAVG